MLNGIGANSRRDPWPVVPVTWFGPPECNPATASVDECALAVAHPTLSPRLDRRDTAILDSAVRVATEPRLRIWSDNPWLCKFDSAREVMPNWLAFRRGFMTVRPGDPITMEHYGMQWSGRML